MTVCRAPEKGRSLQYHEVLWATLAALAPVTAIAQVVVLGAGDALFLEIYARRSRAGRAFNSQIAAAGDALIRLAAKSEEGPPSDDLIAQVSAALQAVAEPHDRWRQLSIQAGRALRGAAVPWAIGCSLWLAHGISRPPRRACHEETTPETPKGHPHDAGAPLQARQRAS
jgi:hypothetical protein